MAELGKTYQQIEDDNKTGSDCLPGVKPIVWQCCYCRLPHREPQERVSHGMHETCFLVHDPESYRGMLATGDDTQPVTGNT